MFHTYVRIFNVMDTAEFFLKLNRAGLGGCLAPSLAPAWLSCRADGRTDHAIGQANAGVP